MKTLNPIELAPFGQRLVVKEKRPPNLGDCLLCLRFNARNIVGVHLGIAMCLGMKTFGLVMITGNLAFVYPETVRDVVGWLSGKFARVNGKQVEPMPAGRESLAVEATH